MTVEVTVPSGLNRFLDVLKPESRRDLYSVGANALRATIRTYIVNQANMRHAWANRLHARPTQHLEKGASRITSSSTPDNGEVHIPIAGMSRAFMNVTITPRTSYALTIPVAAASYGHRVLELERMGWNIFRPKGHDVLMGTHNAGEEPTCLYILRKQVNQEQDRSLLPSDAEMSSSVSRAMVSFISSSIRKAT